MASLIDPKLFRDTVESAPQPFAQRLGATAVFNGDVGPLESLRAQVGQFPLFGGKPLAKLDQELLSRNLPAGTGLAGDDIGGFGADRNAGNVAPARLLAPYDGDLLARDANFEHKFFMLLNLWETHRNWKNVR